MIGGDIVPVIAHLLLLFLHVLIILDTLNLLDGDTFIPFLDFFLDA
jgi:hypothetical protein